MSDHPLLRGIGLALPPTAFSQEATSRHLIETLQLGPADARRVRALYRRSRIRQRHSCLSDARHPLGVHGERLGATDGPTRLTTSERMALFAEHAPPLAVAACRDLFGQPGVPGPERVTHVLAASCTGFLAPGLDVHLTRALELRADVGRTLVGFQGCQAGLSCLRLAEQLCRADPHGAVLITCVELSTLHFQASAEEDDLLAGSLFSDGAAAALVCGAAVPREGPAVAVERTATVLHPDSLEHMTWHVGDEGFELHLSRLLPRLVGFEFAPFLKERFELGPGVDPASRFWAVHPGGAAILDGLQAALEVPDASLVASRRVLAEAGNMSSPTIYFVLREVLDAPDTPELGLALAFGPGLSLEAAALRRIDA